MATTVTETIGTDTRDFSTIIAWEAALPSNLVTADEIRIGECYKDSVFTDNDLVINGLTTDGTRYVQLIAAMGERHTGVRGTGVILRSGASSNAAIRVLTEDVRIFFIEIDCQNKTGGMGISVASVSAGVHYYGNNFIYDNDPTDAGQGGISIGDLDARVFIFGNIVINVGGDGIKAASNGVSDIDNNTVYKANQVNSATRDGISVGSGSGTVTARNNIVMDTGSNGKDFEGTYGTASNNLSGDATAPGTSAQASKSSADQFTDLTAGSEDLSLKTGADAIDNGATLASLGITPDILVDLQGNVRGNDGTWDIGALEKPGAPVITGMEPEDLKKDAFKGGAFKRKSFIKRSFN